MGLVEIAGLVGSVGERGIGGVCCNEAPQADNGSILFWCSAYDRPEPFFECVLADVQGVRQVFDLYDPAVLPDEVKRIVYKGVRFIVCQVFQEEVLYDVDPVFVVCGFSETFHDLAEVGGLEQVLGSYMLFEQLMCRDPGKGVDTTRGKDNQEVGGMFGIGELPDRPSQTCDGSAGKRQSLLALQSHHPAHIPECHYQGCIRYGFTASVKVAFDDDKLPDKWQ